MRLFRFSRFGLLIALLIPLAVSAQIGGTGWKPQVINFKIQWPTNATESSRYWLTNNPAVFGVTNWLYHCLTYSNDGAFSVGNTTQPRTEQRFNPDYTNGEIQYQSVIMCPSNENSYCCFQIHTGDAQSTQYGSTTFMAFWFTNYGGSVHDYSGTTLATNLGGKFFQLNVDHNLVTQTIMVWINGQRVWTQQDNGAGDFYFKDGVYEQGHGPTLQMDTYIITNSIMEWVSSGTNPPAAPTNLVATPTAVKIPLTWTASVNATNYNVKHSTTSGTNYVTLATLNGTSFTDSNAVAGTTYYYVVSALDQFGESSNSTQVAASLVNLGFQLSATPTNVLLIAGANTNFTVTLATNTSFTGTVAFGVGGLPPGAGAIFSPASLNHAGTTTLTLSTAANTPGGGYVLTIQGTNGAFINATNIAFAVAGASAGAGTLVWTNGAGDLNWSSPFNWTNVTVPGNGSPGVSNSVVFTNWSAASASALTALGSGVLIPANVNSFVNANYSIIGLTNFANAPDTSPNFQSLQIANGVTLNTGGIQVGGFTLFDFGGNNVTTFNLSGAGGTLSVTNGIVTVSANDTSGPNNNALLDLSALDNFSMTGQQIRLAVEGSSPYHHASGVLYLAKTNVLTLSTSGYADGGAGSPDSGNPAVTLGHNKSALGNGAQMYLGIANTLSLDYATIGRGDANDLLAFNPAFLAQNPGATIQGTNGANSRVGVYVVGDDSAGEAGSVSNTNDFTGGTINLRANYLCVARGRDSANETTTCNGYLMFDNGSINANTLAIGLLYPAGSNSIANGTVNVNGGTLTVISNIFLATRPNTGGTGSTSGTLNINDGDVLATNISGGGGTSTISLNSGILNLQGGQITNVTTLGIGDGVSDAALLTGAATIGSPSAILVAANGTLAGNTVITSPGLTVNGVISPGGVGVGAMTNNGPATFGAGGGLAITIQNANGSPVSGWDFFRANGALTIGASNSNPFTVQIESFDPNGSGLVTNFNSSSTYAWNIATATGGITDFNADKFTVDASLFQNYLAGGNFSVTTNGNSLVLVFNPQPTPPVIGNAVLSGTNLVISGSGGVTNGTYFVLATTNLALPVTNWTVVATGIFDGSGNFTFTNAVGNAMQNFYLLKLP
ncbi:MAG TPA: fibronectin type III domain-containing protein [Candidatus Sulfotelmatobacter sp.]|nr:fibronectin type III domain-containing protein [Candidatus Sulfotelmatobacter sp.]